MRAALLGALAALAVVGLLALVGAFDGDDGGVRGPGVSPALGQEDAGRINEIFERSSPGVVFVQARVAQEGQSPYGLPEPQEGIATGSGFVIDDDGHVATNAHVVAGASNVRIRFQEGSLVDAEVVGTDASTDIALLKVDPGDAELTPLPPADSGDVKVGDIVLAIGNPLGLEDTVTAGIVSGKQRRIEAPNGFPIENVIQTDAAVNQGNSGGPLLDMQGRVIGINSQIATAGGTGFIGIAFAVPSNTAKRVIAELKADGRVDRAFLGVSAVGVTPQLARELGLGTERGALVVAVSDGSPADRAGIQPARGEGGALTGPGDVIVEIGDREVRSPEDMARAISEQRPGSSVTITIVRAGDRREVRARLGTRPG
jgi:S1-C subfamily serine protease